jgi:hypothetical protein
VHKLLAWLVVSSAIYYKLELLRLWTFKAPTTENAQRVGFVCFFPKTFENESLKNFSTSIAVYNPSFISGFLRRDFTSDEIVKTLQPFFFFSFTSLRDQIL